MRNFDVNVYDHLAYMTNGEQWGQWRFVLYALPHEGAPYGSGMELGVTDMDEHDVNVMRCHLEDDDFWIDTDSLIDEGRISRKLLRWVQEREQELETYLTNVERLGVEK